MNPPAAVPAARQATSVAGSPSHRALHPLGPTSTCTICGCDLSGHRLFHIRYRVCPEHATADVVLNKGVPSRFCQQCGRFHHLEAFEPSLRSCRQQLARHAARRRERRRQAAAAKAAAAGAGAPPAAAQQQEDGQQKRRRQPQPLPQEQQQPPVPQLVQQQRKAAIAASQGAGRAGQPSAAEPVCKRRRAGSEGSTLSSHDAGTAAALGPPLISGGSSGQQLPAPAALPTTVPLLTAVPASMAAPALNAALSPAWLLQAAGLPPLAAPQQAAPAWPPVTSAAPPVPADTSAQSAEAAFLLAAIMREPGLASLLSPRQQFTPPQLSDLPVLPSEAAASEDAAGAKLQPNTWEAASRPPRAQEPQPAPKPAPSPALPLTLSNVAAASLPGMQLPLAAALPQIPAPQPSLGSSQPGIESVTASLQRAATQELMSRMQLGQRDFDVECQLLRLAAMTPAECEAHLLQLLAGLSASGVRL